MKTLSEVRCQICGAGMPDEVKECPACGSPRTKHAPNQPARGEKPNEPEAPAVAVVAYLVGALALAGGAIIAGVALGSGASDAGSATAFGFATASSSVLWFAIGRGIILLNRIAHHSAATHELIRKESER